WHWPVVVVMSERRTNLEGLNLALVRLFVTVGAATLSYYLVELPIRRGFVFRQWRARIATPIGISLTAVALLGATAAATAPPDFLVAPRSGVLSSEAPASTTPTTQAPTPLPTSWV